MADNGFQRDDLVTVAVIQSKGQLCFANKGCRRPPQEVEPQPDLALALALVPRAIHIHVTCKRKKAVKSSPADAVVEVYNHKRPRSSPISLADSVSVTVRAPISVAAPLPVAVAVPVHKHVAGLLLSWNRELPRGVRPRVADWRYHVCTPNLITPNLITC